MIIHRCKICAKEFETKRKLATFCSRKCYGIAKTGKENWNWKDGRCKAKQECSKCGKIFVNRSRQKYCSKICYGLAKRKRTEKSCLTCNKIFIVNFLSNRKYCSKECDLKAKTGVRRGKILSYDWVKGKNSYFWKGGVNKLSQRIRNSVEYKIWRTAIFCRDNYECIVGDKFHGNKLNVDHYPISFAEILKKNNIKTFAQAICCKELWDINNGRTLCVNCHKKTDNYLKRNQL